MGHAFQPKHLFDIGTILSSNWYILPLRMWNDWSTYNTYSHRKTSRGSLEVQRLMKNFHLPNALTPVYMQRVRFCVDVCKLVRILPIRAAKNRDFEEVRWCEVCIVKARRYGDDT